MKQMKFFIISIMVLFILSACTEKYPNKIDSGDPVLTGSNCAVCHLDKELLKEVADPLPPPPDGEGSGEG